MCRESGAGVVRPRVWWIVLYANNLVSGFSLVCTEVLLATEHNLYAWKLIKAAMSEIV